MSGPDYRQQEECEQEMWECVYCGKPVPQSIQAEMNLCCGELGHGQLASGSRNQMAFAESVAGKD